MFSIGGTLRSVCKIEGAPFAPAALLFIESRTFLVALFESSPPPVSPLALKILVSALLLRSSSDFSVSLVLPEPGLCSALFLVSKLLYHFFHKEVDSSEETAMASSGPNIVEGMATTT